MNLNLVWLFKWLWQLSDWTPFEVLRWQFLSKRFLLLHTDNRFQTWVSYYWNAKKGSFVEVIFRQKMKSGPSVYCWFIWSSSSTLRKCNFVRQQMFYMMMYLRRCECCNYTLFGISMWRSWWPWRWRSWWR